MLRRLLLNTSLLLFFRGIKFTKLGESQGFASSRFSLRETFLNESMVFTFLLSVAKFFFKLIVDTFIIIRSISI